jgi:4-hydroxy-3-polyprenylbenzoate decarboxylase
MLMKHYILAMTGASGCIYGYRLVEELLKHPVALSVIVTDTARYILREEMGIKDTFDDMVHICNEMKGHELCEVECFMPTDLRAYISSGSHKCEAMIIAPASMGVVARIASGISSNLVERCADICLKEDYPLVIVPRETPLSIIHLENMLHIARAGGKIIPASPGFYHHPKCTMDMVNFVVQKVMNFIGLETTLISPWNPKIDVPSSLC